jgi:hypothetical protein
MEVSHADREGVRTAEHVSRRSVSQGFEKFDCERDCEKGSEVEGKSGFGFFSR